MTPRKEATSTEAIQMDESLESSVSRQHLSIMHSCTNPYHVLNTGPEQLRSFFQQLNILSLLSPYQVSIENNIKRSSQDFPLKGLFITTIF